MIKSIGKFLSLFRLELIFVLMPVYFAALLISPNFGQDRLGLVFVLVHLMLYPADHLLRSYFGNKNAEFKNSVFGRIFVFGTIIILQSFALFNAIKINLWLVLFTVLYLCASWISARRRQSSNERTADLFQAFYRGALVVLLVYIGLNDYEPANLLNLRVPGMAIFSMLFFLVLLNGLNIFSAPHESGRAKLPLREGVSLMIFTAFLFYLIWFFEITLVWVLLVTILPGLLFYVFLIRSAYKNDQMISSVRLNIFYGLLSVGLNAFFIYAFLEHTNVLQVFS